MINGRVFVTRQLDPDAIELLRREFATVDVWEDSNPPPAEVLRERASGCVALVTLLTEKVNGALLDAAPGLKVVSNVAVGYDNFDLASARARGVRLSNTPGVLTKTTADLTFALLMAVARRIVESVGDARAGRWGPWHPAAWMGEDIYEHTLGIVGLGRIGLEMARRASGFDMRVLYTDQVRRSEEDEREYGLEYVSGFTDLLSQADFVTVHVPLTSETRHLIGAEALKAMKPTAFLINTSRGEVVDQDALLAALRDGTIAGAALDVTTPEPLPPDHPLMGLPNVVIAPHIGSASRATRRSMALLAAENAIAACKGEPMPSQVDTGGAGR